MRTRTISIEARPDPRTGEKQWFSPLDVPANHVRLTSGEAVAKELFDRVMQGIAEAVTFLPPCHPYQAKHFVDGWDELNDGDRRRAGRCIADVARRNGSAIGVIHCGRNSAHHYFIRQVAPQTPTVQAPNPQHHQS